MGRYAVFFELSDVDNFPHLPVCKCMRGVTVQMNVGDGKNAKCNVQLNVVRTFSILVMALVM